MSDASIVVGLHAQEEEEADGGCCTMITVNKYVRHTAK